MNYLSVVIGLLYAQLVFATPCNSALHNDFDFWLGDWQVFKPDGSLAGSNNISKDYNNCVLRERYTAVTGYIGESLNVFDASRGVWHQTWVDSSGNLLVLEGHLVNGNMELVGNNTDANGQLQQHRIRWTPHPDGSVRQHWQAKTATGDWATIFDGLYKKTHKIK